MAAPTIDAAGRTAPPQLIRAKPHPPRRDASPREGVHARLRPIAPAIDEARLEVKCDRPTGIRSRTPQRVRRRRRRRCRRHPRRRALARDPARLLRTHRREHRPRRGHPGTLGVRPTRPAGLRLHVREPAPDLFFIVAKVEQALVFLWGVEAELKHLFGQQDVDTQKTDTASEMSARPPSTLSPLLCSIVCAPRSHTGSARQAYRTYLAELDRRCAARIGSTLLPEGHRRRSSTLSSR
jgi:hypothetical protein